MVKALIFTTRNTDNYTFFIVDGHYCWPKNLNQPVSLENQELYVIGHNI